MKNPMCDLILLLLDLKPLNVLYCLKKVRALEETGTIPYIDFTTFLDFEFR